MPRLSLLSLNKLSKCCKELNNSPLLYYCFKFMADFDDMAYAICCSQFARKHMQVFVLRVLIETK
jgi:hypothetical protein